MGFDTHGSWLIALGFASVPASSRPRRLARPRTSPFHGGNTGSNPVGDAKLIVSICATFDNLSAQIINVYNGIGIVILKNPRL